MTPLPLLAVLAASAWSADIPPKVQAEYERVKAALKVGAEHELHNGSAFALDQRGCFRAVSLNAKGEAGLQAYAAEVEAARLGELVHRADHEKDVPERRISGDETAGAAAKLRREYRQAEIRWAGLRILAKELDAFRDPDEWTIRENADFRIKPCGPQKGEPLGTKRSP